MKPLIACVLALVSVLLGACSYSSYSATATPTATEEIGPPVLATDTTPGAEVSATTPAGAATSAPGQLEGVATDTLNVRAGPGLTFAVKSQLKSGDTITIIGKSADGLWWQFSGGWVSGTYIKVTGDPTVVPVATPGP